MKRTVREIISDCRDGNEVMSLGEFVICLKAINNHLKAACLFPDGSRESKKHFRIADEICLAVEDCFSDQNDNLINWFRRGPCRFRHPDTGKDVTVEVRDDIEAIYYFLYYCMMLNRHKEMDDDFMDYLSYVLCEPVDE